MQEAETWHNETQESVEQTSESVVQYHRRRGVKTEWEDIGISPVNVRARGSDQKILV